VNERILSGATIKTFSNILNRNAILMAHTARGGESVVDEGEVVEEEIGRGFGRRERGRDAVEDGRGGGMGGVVVDGVGKFFGAMNRSFIEKNILQ
jgi:hypothetical protein